MNTKLNFMNEHVTGARLRKLTTAVYEMGHNSSHVHMIMAAKIVYVKTDFWERVLNTMAKRTKPCVLISHNSDIGIDSRMWRYRTDNVVKWYAENVMYKHPDLVPIPLGCENMRSPGYSGNMGIVDRVVRMREKPRKFVYLNCNPNTNSAVRGPLVEKFKDKDWVTYDPYGIQFEDCLKQLKAHTFVFCPTGNGLDTHRFSEAVYLGAIPIVLRSHMYECWSDDIPIVMVDSWDEVTQEMLNDWLAVFKTQQFNYNCMKMSYWTKRIRAWR